MKQPAGLFCPISAIACLLVFFAVAISLFHYGLEAPMYYDSQGRLEAKKAVFEHGNMKDVLRLFPQRPVTMATFYLNYHLFGWDPSSFRMVNLFLLAATSTVLVYLIALLLKIAAPHATVREIYVTSGLCGLFFLVHPLQTWVALYIWQRAALLACFFYFSSLLLYFTSRSGMLVRPFIGYIGAFVLFICAVLSKENAVTLPLIIILGEIALFRTSWKQILFKSTPLILAVFGIMLLHSFIQAPHGNLQSGTGILTTISRYYQDCALSVTQVALTQSRMMFAYVAAIFLPDPSRIHLVSPQVLSHSLMNPPVTIVAVSGVLALGLLGIWMMRRRPLSGFGIVFFMINLVPEAMLVPQFAFFGYRAMLPMLGLLLIVADAVIFFLVKIRDDYPAAYRKVAVLLVILGLAAIIPTAGASVHKAKLWSDPTVFWRDEVNHFPRENFVERSVRLHALLSLGSSLARVKEYAEAMACFQQAAEVVPESHEAYFHMGAVSRRTGNREQAIKYLRKADSLRPGNSLIRRELEWALAGQ